MGCDIHAFGEVRVNGKWQSLDCWENNFEYIDKENKDPIVSVPYGSEVYRKRSYTLFSALCGVRCSAEHENIKRLCENPRGFPIDASEVLLNYRSWEDVDGHSDSWNTLAEINNFDWSIWDMRYQDCRDFVSDINKNLKEKTQFIEGVTQKDIRIVYWFDN